MIKKDKAPSVLHTIWKYSPIGLDKEKFEITMPTGTEILTFQLQGTAPTLWALVNPALPPERRGFILHNTGVSIDVRTGRYVGTIQLNNKVYHLFEEAR